MARSADEHPDCRGSNSDRDADQRPGRKWVQLHASEWPFAKLEFCVVQRQT